MLDVVRQLTEHEVTLLKPELGAYIAWKEAQARLTRMLGLFAPGCDLDLQTLSLVREIADPAPADEVLPAASE